MSHAEAADAPTHGQQVHKGKAKLTCENTHKTETSPFGYKMTLPTMSKGVCPRKAKGGLEMTSSIKRTHSPTDKRADCDYPKGCGKATGQP